MKKIAAIGSLSMDFVVETDENLGRGRPYLAKTFKRLLVVKEPTSCSRPKIRVRSKMFGCVGADSFGNEIISNLKKQNVNVDYVERVAHEASYQHTSPFFKGIIALLLFPVRIIK